MSSPLSARARAAILAAADAAPAAMTNGIASSKRSISDGVESEKPIKKFKVQDKVVVKKALFMPGMAPPVSTAPPVPPELARAVARPTPSTTDSTINESLKKEFIDNLTPDLRQLLQLEIDTMGDDWFVALRGEFVKPYFRDLKSFIVKEQQTQKVFPPANDIYSWSRLCPLAAIRVVVIGQDPYHDDGQAHGLAFSVRKGVRIPPSLRNMYKELANEIPGFKVPQHGDLTKWARQGVLLLNTSLTVRAHQAASHSRQGWDTFTNAILDTIISRLSPTGAEAGAKGVVFMAWGAHAGKLCTKIGKDHLVLKSAHPSPLSASRGFLGNGHFNKANEWLEEKYGKEGRIDWELD